MANVVISKGSAREVLRLLQIYAQSIPPAVLLTTAADHNRRDALRQIRTLTDALDDAERD